MTFYGSTAHNKSNEYPVVSMLRGYKESFRESSLRQRAFMTYTVQFVGNKTNSCRTKWRTK